MKILIIDDTKERHDELSKEYNKTIDEEVVIHHAWDYDSSMKLLAENVYDLICFDHDLNDFDEGMEYTGASVARFMADNGMKCKEVRVHSHNPKGAKEIISIIRSRDVSRLVYYQPFSIFPGAEMKGLKSWLE